MLPLYAARIEDLGPGDLVKVDCAGIVNLADPARLKRGAIIGKQRSSPTRAAAPPTRRAYHGRLS